MDDHLRHQRDTSIGQLEELIRRGRHIRDARSVDAARAWQQDCAAAVNQLSGGSKAHWLARAYSEAFLVRAADGAVVVEADATDIVDRTLSVLAQGAASLSRMDDVAAASSGAGPRPRRFDFVHDAALRPVLERALDDSRGALDRGEFALALILSCGILDAMITDALDAGRRRDASAGHAAAPAPRNRTDAPSASANVGSHRDPTNQRWLGAEREGWSGPPAPGARITDWSFEARIAEAERVGLIRGGCARLPPVARAYRDLTDADGELRAGATAAERDARIAGQVLRVVMRDLDPGR